MVGNGRLVALGAPTKRASHLLTRKVTEVGSPVWNAKLQKYIRWAGAARAVNEDQAELAAYS